MYHIKLAHAFSSNLALRDTVDTVFNRIESIDESDIMIDFQGIVSISRSFAHQYVLRKKQSTKNISESNLSNHIHNMLAIVQNRSGSKSMIQNLDRIEAIA